MRKTILVLSLVLVILALTPLAISRAFVAPTTYETIYVKPGDTVWQIAANYITDKDDVREVVFEIRRINKLDNNAKVYPGQALKVPVKS
ncbi:Cell division suppressor protein YneA [Sporomusa silvacetica DSM 10669]|uniref:Cell division suppressor protein YneA n=1 Tax=Sporomusa silvacetica DSM 10669 TaxID=1123289 RepID=A0ABZ3ING6_9FIRM|nr:LysM domain-containing protein [Sporomusa silvacetica]OZC14748.1 cell division suppressor protein YneA [Sporomusa silvacetica DSM 10669]